MLIVIDLSEAAGPSARARRLHPLLGRAWRATATWPQVVRSRAGPAEADGEHVVVDPVRPAGAGRARRHRGVGRGLRRHVRVCRRKGLGGGRRRHPGPYRATPRGGLSRLARPVRCGEAGLSWTPARAPLPLRRRPAIRRRGRGPPESSWEGRMAIRDYDRLFIGGDWVAPEGTETIGVISPVDRGGHRPGARRHRGRHRQGRGGGAYGLRPRARGRAWRRPSGARSCQGCRGADHRRDGRHGRDHHAGDGLAHHLLDHGPGAGARP